MNRPICVIALVYIFIILGLHYIGVVFLNYTKICNEVTKNNEYKGIVINEKEEQNYKYIYVVKLKSENKLINGKNFIINVKKNNNSQKLYYGDEINFKGKYIIPESKRNYGGFDYSLYMKTQKLYGSFEIENYKLLRKNKGNFIQKNIFEFKQYVKNILRKYLKKDSADLCIGLIIGDRTNLSEEIEEDFKNSNLTHMLAVSGSHFTYIILTMSYINKIIKRKRMGQIVTIIFIVLFMNLTGNTASVVRSGIMAIIIILASLIYKRVDIWTSMAIAILIQLINNPYIIFDIGLQLSYSGVIGIVLFNKIIIEKENNIIDFFNKKIIKKYKLRKRRIVKYITEATAVTLSANIIIIPIMIYHFNTISLSFVFSNLLAGPILGITVIYAFVLIFASIIFNSLLSPFYYILNIMLNILLKIAHICAKIPFSKIIVVTPNIYLICIFYAFLIIMLYIKQKKIKKITALLLILIIILNLLVPVINSKKQELTINFIDVGQGDSTLIRVDNKNILIDGGGSLYADSFDVGEKTLFPYLMDRGIYKLDYVIVSHFDADHSQGLIYIMKNMKVKNAIVSSVGQESKEYEDFLTLAKNKKTKLIYAKKGDILQFKNAKIQIIYPDSEKIIDNEKNNNALVCKLVWHNFSMLFTGDIESKAEEKLLTMYNKNNAILKANVLKVAHHGSKTSSMQEFIKAVNAQIALIGVGKNNKFGHPNDGVIRRLIDNGCKIYRTDMCGEIELKVKKNGSIIIKTILDK